MLKSMRPLPLLFMFFLVSCNQQTPNHLPSNGPLWTDSITASQVQKLLASDGASGDQFGWGVAVSGEKAIVSALGDNGQGTVKFYSRGPSGWIEGLAFGPTVGGNPEYGISVAIDGDTAVVGAKLEQAAYVYHYSGVWSFQAKLTPPQAAGWFGDEVSISGDTVIVGAPLANAAYVFTRSGATWTLKATLTASDGTGADFFGRTVAISGDTAVVGAATHDNNSVVDSGAAYVFEKPATGWANMTETAKLTASDGSPIDFFGWYVVIDGNTVGVGALNADVNFTDSGAAYVFEKPATGWANMTETAKLTASDGGPSDFLGEQLALEGDIIIAGSPRHDSFGNNSAGAVYVFEKPATGWANMMETAKLNGSDTAAGDEFGWSVDLSEGTAFIGANFNDNEKGSNAGAAYVFFLNSPPVITTDTDPVFVNEGGLATNTGTIIDPNGDPVTLTAGIGAVINNNDGTWSWSFSTSDGPTESQTITIDADDGNGGTAQTSFLLTVNNVDPTIDAVIVPAAPVNIFDQPLTATATFSDPANIADEPYTCTIDYGDGSGPQAGTVTSMTCTGPDQTYAEPGVYTITVTVTDKDGDSGSADAETFIVIYDPDGGFVTGGGWIDSPVGAYIPDPTLTGKANFGFVSKYKKGAQVPTGNTEFNFKVADLNFHSDSYDWLVINQGGTNAQYKGSGTINGDPSPTGELYKFMLWATDNDPGGDDAFRIKIWYEDNGDVLVYDNGPGQAIGGGNIKVHKK